MFASRTKKIVSLQEGDEQIDVTIRKLSGRSLDKAHEAHQGSALAQARNAGAELVKAFNEVATANAPDDPDKADDTQARYSGYDLATLLQSGIESISGIHSKDLQAAINDLDREAETRLFHEILDLSLPPVNAQEVQAKS